MSSALRALSAAALAVGQAALTPTDNGTYLAKVTLDSVPVNLLVDMHTAGVWVKCTALEGPSCADGIWSGSPGYTNTRLERFVQTMARKTTDVQIAGQMFHGFDAYVFYHLLPDVDASIQGVLGLKRSSTEYGSSASMYLDDQVTTVALQLGESASDSKLSLDTVDRSLLTKKGVTTAVTASDKMKCFSVPLADGSNACTSTSGTVIYDPGFPSLGVSSETLDTLERWYLYTCTKLGTTYRVTGFTCDASVKLPRLSLQIGTWRFFLDPSEYTTPVKGASQVQLLTGDIPSMYSGWVLGAPFLRKYPFVYNATGDDTLYCKENTTCTKVLPTPKTYAPSYGGGYSGGGGGGGSGTSSSFELDAETRRQRGKLYLTIGLSIGGVIFFAVCGWLCKSCMADSAETTEEEDAKTKEDASVELAVSVAIAVGDASDESDSETSKNKRLVKKEDRNPSRKTESSNDKRKPTSRRTKEDQDSSSSEDDSDDSSSYDSESSEERRRERRRRRRRRHERRRERELRRQSELTATTTVTTAAGDDPEETPYVAASSPKNNA